MILNITPTTFTSGKYKLLKEGLIKTAQSVVLVILAAILLIGCTGSRVEIGYRPPLIPIRVSIDQQGRLTLSSSYAVSTPIGTFDVSAGHSVAAIRRSVEYPVLIIRVDGVMTVYELSPGHAFDVEFFGDERHYKKVRLQRFPDGDMVLELESVPIVVNVPPTAVPTTRPRTPNTGSSGTVQRPANPVYSDWCPGAFETRLAIGARAKVVAVPRLVVREGPNTRSQPVHGHSLSNGRTITILEGPVCDGGMLWWKAESGIITLTNGQQHNIVGWMAEESGDEWLLEPLR